MIPQSPEHRQKLNKYIDQTVQLMHEQDTIKEDIKNVKSLVSDELGKDVGKEFMLLVKARYQAEKLQELVDKASTALAEDEILRGNV